MAVKKTKGGIYKVSAEDSRWIMRTDGKFHTFAGEDGLWSYGGGEVTHHGIKKLLTGSIKHDKDGYYHEQKLPDRVVHTYFQTEDTAFYVMGVRYFPTEVKLHLNDGTTELLRPETLFTEDFFNPRTEETEKDMLYCTVKPRKHKTRFEKNTRQDFLDRLEERDGKLVLHLESIVLEFPQLKIRY